MSSEMHTYLEEMEAEIQDKLDSMSEEEQERVATMVKELIEVLKKDSEISMYALTFLFFQGLKYVYPHEQESTDS